MAKIINVNSLSFSYLQKPILQDISLSISSGEALVLLGASGTGKTTLLRLLAGLLEPSLGTIEFCQPAAGVGTRLVFQQPRLFPWLSVRGNLHFALRAAQTPREEWDLRIETLLSEVGLADAIDLSIAALSVGMAQRIALVRALCCQPQVLLLDEPFSALDPKRRRQLQEDLLRLIHLTKVTVVMVTHDVEEALSIGDQIVVLQGEPAGITLSIQPSEISIDDARTTLLQTIHQ